MVTKDQAVKLSVLSITQISDTTHSKNDAEWCLNLLGLNWCQLSTIPAFCGNTSNTNHNPFRSWNNVIIIIIMIMIMTMTMTMTITITITILLLLLLLLLLIIIIIKHQQALRLPHTCWNLFYFSFQMVNGLYCVLPVFTQNTEKRRYVWNTTSHNFFPFNVIIHNPRCATYLSCWVSRKLFFSPILWLVTGQNVNKPKRRQPKRRQTKTSTNRNVDRPKRRQTKTSTNRNVDKPKRRQTKTSTDQNVDKSKLRHTKTSTNRNDVDKPKRRQAKTSTDHFVIRYAIV